MRGTGSRPDRSLWLLLNGSGQALACSCARPVGSPSGPMPGDVAFVGTVRRVVDDVRNGQAGRTFTFRIQEPFSGVDGASADVFSDKSSCGVE